jgi:chaperonin GroES
MRKDQLAAGARSAKFAVGGTAIPGAEDNIFRNVSKEPRNADVITVDHAPVVKKVFTPRGTTLLVRRVTLEELSTIIDTEKIEKERPAEGTVLRVGKKVDDVIVGDHVIFGKYAGTEFKLNGEVLLIMDEEDIKGTVEDEPTITWLPVVEMGCDAVETSFGGCVETKPKRSGRK